MASWWPIIVALSEDPHVRSVIAALLAGALAAYAASAKTVVVGTPTPSTPDDNSEIVDPQQNAEQPLLTRSLPSTVLSTVCTSLRSFLSAFTKPFTKAAPTQDNSSAQKQFEASITNGPTATAAAAASPPPAAAASSPASVSPSSSSAKKAPSPNRKRSAPKGAPPDPAPPEPGQGAAPAPGPAKRSLID